MQQVHHTQFSAEAISYTKRRKMQQLSEAIRYARESIGDTVEGRECIALLEDQRESLGRITA